VVYPPLPPLPPGPPGTPGWQYNQQINPALTTPPAVAGQLQAQAAMAQQAAAEASLAARRQRMAGRWFTPEHGWLAISGEIATVGLTDYAAQGLGDILHVSLPVAGAAVTAGDPCGQVESAKAISDLYAPADGEVTEVNAELATSPRLLNADPYGAGWMYRVRLAASGGESALRPGLLSPSEYEELTKGVG
jgi:glycine cleavage system H protein